MRVSVVAPSVASMSSQALRLLAAGAWLLLALHGEAECCTNVTSLSQQLDTALAEYEREAAPARPVRVRLAFDLHHAAVRADTVHMLGDIVLTWQEPRITWDPSEWGCDSVLVSAERLWLPDVALLNGAGWAGGAEGAGDPLSVRLSSDGRAAWVVHLDAAVPAPLELARWPNDVLTAAFKFGSRSHNDDELRLDIEDAKKVVFEAGSWELVSVTSSVTFVDGRDSGEGEAGPGRVVAAWRVLLRRRAPAQVAAARAVFAAVLLMLLAAAALAPSARPSLCACASFTAALWLVTALLRLPGGGGAQAPAAVRAMCVLCGAGGAAAAAAALVARAARCSRQPPRQLRTLASAFSKLYSLSPTEETCEAEVGAWAALARLLDLLAVGALLLVLLVTACLYI